MTDYRYPYRPAGREFRYVPESDAIMRLAMRYARQHSLDDAMPNASVVVASGKPIAVAANGSNYHRVYGCRRRLDGSATGRDYHLCEGCHPRNHSERRVLRQVLERGLDARGADLYLWGHFGCCPDCWGAIDEAGIHDIYLVRGAEALFNERHPDNVIGRQFERRGSQLETREAVEEPPEAGRSHSPRP